MAVLMAKCERLRQAYSDYKHLSTDNLSFVAGLRGRPIPAPVGRPKARRRSKAEAPKGAGDKGADENDDDDISDKALSVKQACPSRSCAPRAEKLEAMMEKRITAQTARHKAQSKLNLARERAQEAETKLEETKAELVRMTKAITEGDERTDFLRDTLRNEGSINKAFAEELDALLAEAMNLRRECTVDTLPPRPSTPIVPPKDDDESDHTSTYREDGRTLERPITAPGQSQHLSYRYGKSGPYGGGREWAHSGQLGNPGIFVRPPRPRTGNDRKGVSADDHSDCFGQERRDHQNKNNNGGHFDLTPSRAGGTKTIMATAACGHKSALGGAGSSPTSTGTVRTVPHSREGETVNDGPGVGGEAGAGAGAGVGEASGLGDGHINKRLSKSEDAWSCCGKSLSSAGRGCEPVEPLATPIDLLLDTIDPRSRLGQSLDFREYLPRTAWMGLTPAPAHRFASSPAEGTRRPHTAPERLMGAALGRRNSHAQTTEGEFCRFPIRSRNGGLVGGVWASGGRRRGEGGAGRGAGYEGRTLEMGSPPSPDSGVDAWWQTETTHQWGGATGHCSAGGRGARKVEGVGSRLDNFPKRHGFLRRSHPTVTTATYASSRSSARKNDSTASTLSRSGSRARGGAATPAPPLVPTVGITDPIAPAGGELCPRTQIMGMNGGRLPREVRQVPIDRPLTAPCGKVGRRRVRTHGGGSGRTDTRR